ncbi:ABC transporter permease [Nonomuraea sp. MG754425]|uniref:ABC transporter permease n=1 Tax=Nonomuraea sp. MG754425 TaxID=2570319 RepID=UPI001F3D59DA|nr:ABC transporter permease [Nonomuraea sp. MG754425]MCF6476023.1 ABC transporter permease [Nonomuraea sp. MG754425]
MRALERQGEFYARAVAALPAAARYRKEVLRLLAEVSLGTGGLAVIGGTTAVVAFMTFFTGTEVGLQGYTGLDRLGGSAFTGFLSSYVNTREIAPIVAAIGLSATVGAGFTAQLGAMRISDEVDALEVMAVPPMAFLVGTRLIAGFAAVVPLYVLGLLASYVSTRLIVTVFHGQSAGTYDHYFDLFLVPYDVLWSFGKALVFAVIVILVHCYYGFHATGGPAGVGVAVGRAVRAVLVAVNVANILLGLAIWGTTTTVRLAG